jgi:hypothetical protein
MARPPQVLLLTEDHQRRQVWEHTLRKSVEFCADDRPLDGTLAPEVVVTDHLPVNERLADCGSLFVRGEIGIIAVGVSGPDDVSLPADYSTRELRLAC